MLTSLYYDMLIRHRYDVASMPLNFLAVEPNSTIVLTAVGSPAAIALDYSTDGTTWSSYTIGTTITLANVGDRVFFRGNNSTFCQSTSNFYRFEMAGKIEAHGNINSLYDASCTSLIIPNHDYFFAFLFDACASLVTAPLLPATTLRNRCYYTMLRGTSIVEPPALPATRGISYCYQRMFMDCNELRRTPILPIKTFAYSGLYYAMFNGCAKLNYVHCALTTWPTTTNATVSWLADVANEGVFYCPESLDTSIRDANHIPTGWTVVTY